MVSFSLLVSCRRFQPLLLQASYMSNQSPSPIDPNKNLRREVVDLYKQLIFLSRGWHIDLKPKIRDAFIKNRDLSDPNEIRKLIAKGEYICQEIIAAYRLKKYRTMKKRYYSEED